MLLLDFPASQLEGDAAPHLLKRVVGEGAVVALAFLDVAPVVAMAIVVWGAAVVLALFEAAFSITATPG